MELDVWQGDIAELQTEALVVGCCEGWRGAAWDVVDTLAGKTLRDLCRSVDFTGKPDQLLLLPPVRTVAAKRLLLVGLGPRRQVDERIIREAAGHSMRHLVSIGVRRCATLLHWEGGRGRFIRASADGIMGGGYAFTPYKTGAGARQPAERALFPCRTVRETATAKGIIASAAIEGRAVWRARDLVNQPGNVAHPHYLAEQAVSLSSRRSVSCRVLDRSEMDSLSMNGILAVAKGSRQEPVFIVLEYSGGSAADRPTVLVGKGVTFDSGGISLKPGEGMELMKNDMAGAATVLETVMAAAEQALPVNLVGLIPAAENMPGGQAYKPGDIIRTMSGKTVEVVNTDAEGRLLLCDALHFARRYKPAEIIDVATLTGACVVALGQEATGLMSTDDSLAGSLEKAGASTGERVWRLPLWDEYGKLLESDIADLKNVGGRTAGALTAGWFLKQFAPDVCWAHLDIAGTAWEEKGRHHLPKGATGVGVRLLLEYLRSK